LFLSRLDLLLSKFPPFILDVFEVVNSPAELQKCVCTQNEQEMEALAQNWANRIVRFGKPDSPVLSAPPVIKGTVGSSEDVLLSTKWCLT
jgi:hypothetical protein